MSPTRRIVLPAAAALVAALLPGAASPASAQAQRTTDAVGDLSFEDGPGPGQRTADVVGLRSQHGEQRVTVTLDMDAMVDGGKFYATVVVRTDAGRYELDYARTRRGDFEVVDVVRGPVDQGRVVRCGGAASEFSPARRSVRVSAPRRCLGDPRWVQTGALVETRPPQRGATVYTDDARRDGDAAELRIKVGGRRLTRG